MRSFLLLAVLVPAISAAEDLRVDIWNGMLLVRGPATGSKPLPGAEQRMTVTWQDQTLDEVAEFLRVACRLNVVILPGAGERRVTLSVRDMALGNLVSWIGRQTDTYTDYQGQALLFSTALLRGAETMRMYDVTDLTRPVQDFPGPELAFSTAGKGNGVTLNNTTEAKGGQSVEDLAEFIRRQIHVE
jgi:hypothetical protein